MGWEWLGKSRGTCVRSKEERVCEVPTRMKMSGTVRGKKKEGLLTIVQDGWNEVLEDGTIW
jgi:hypothetical protein